MMIRIKHTGNFFLVVILLFFSKATYSQDINYENRATQFFFDSIFINNYGRIKTLEFSGQTENKMSQFGIHQICFDKEITLYRALENNAAGKILSTQKLELSGISNIKTKEVNINSKKRLKLFVLQSNEVLNKVYVALKIYKYREFTDIYFIEMLKNGDIQRWCKASIMH